MFKVMVFTDVIVLTTALPSVPRALSNSEDRMDRCRLLDGLGLSRVLDFVEAGAWCRFRCTFYGLVYLLWTQMPV